MCVLFQMMMAGWAEGHACSDLGAGNPISNPKNILAADATLQIAHVRLFVTNRKCVQPNGCTTGYLWLVRGHPSEFNQLNAFNLFRNVHGILSLKKNYCWEKIDPPSPVLFGRKKQRVIELSEIARKQIRKYFSRPVSAAPNRRQQNFLVANTTLETAYVCLSVPNRKLVQPIVPFGCCWIKDFIFLTKP